MFFHCLVFLREWKENFDGFLTIRERERDHLLAFYYRSIRPEGTNQLSRRGERRRVDSWGCIILLRTVQADKQTLSLLSHGLPVFRLARLAERQEKVIPTGDKDFFRAALLPSGWLFTFLGAGEETMRNVRNKISYTIHNLLTNDNWLSFQPLSRSGKRIEQRDHEVREERSCPLIMRFERSRIEPCRIMICDLSFSNTNTPWQELLYCSWIRVFSINLGDYTCSSVGQRFSNRYELMSIWSTQMCEENMLNHPNKDKKEGISQQGTKW